MGCRGVHPWRGEGLGMKTFLKPSVKASEKFFVVLEEPVVAPGVGSGDDVVASVQVGEFLLGVSVLGGVERVLPVGRGVGASGSEWSGAVGVEVLRELGREKDVFVLHGVVECVGGVERVVVWSAEVHVNPARVAAMERALEVSGAKFEARMQVLAERAWVKACGRGGVSVELASAAVVVSPVVPVVPAGLELGDEDDETMFYLPEGFEEEAFV